MSNIIELPNFKSIKDAENYAQGLFMQLAAAQAQNKELAEKLEHAESLLKATPSIEIGEGSSDDVEKLLLREIGYLEVQSRIGGLDNDETKRLKMLVDGLVSHRRQKNDQVPERKQSQKRLNTNELLSIVKNNE